MDEFVPANGSGTATALIRPPMRIKDFQQRLRDLGAKPVHEHPILRNWAQARPLNNGRFQIKQPLPAPLRNALPSLTEELLSMAHLHSKHRGEDGSARLLVNLADGQTIESVLLPRGSLCVSTQVGCAVGCLFCMTGQEGLLRQLGSTEIVAQVALARTLRTVDRVVFMGMGEPAHNMDNTLEAIELLGTHGGIAHKNLVFSTVGDRRVFERLPEAKVKPALALSLHSTNAKLRTHLLPQAPLIKPEELVELAEEYARKVKYPIQYQWTLLAGINDTNEELEGIVKLLTGKHAIMNLIPYNRIDGLDFDRPSPERAREMARYLHQHGILTKLRQSAGQDVDGGCGQLRARAASTRQVV